MEQNLYLQMATLQNQHWWFLARRSIVERLLKKLHLPVNADILEVGCGTGGNLPMLATYGHVYAVELNDMAREFAQRSGCAEVQSGALPYAMPFAEKQFDLIVLMDVLEHLQDDLTSLQVLRKSLKPTGYLLITVPALPFLWSQHDESHHHYRRYLKKPLQQLLEQAGYKPILLSYFNVFLFPLIVVTRFFHRFFHRPHDDQTLPTPWVNDILRTIFASERFLIGKIPLPIGVSIITIAQSSKS